MKAVISKDQLVAMISKIQSIVSTKPAISILANLLIEAIDDQLILSATDLTTSMRCYAEAKVIEEGALALPAKRFFQLTRELTSPQIKITSLTDEIAEIASGSSHFKINGMNKSDFPTLPDISSSQTIPISSSKLKEMLTKTVFSVAKDDNRYVLNGIHLQVANGEAVFMSTDGKRLSKVSAPLEVDSSFLGSYVLPLKAVDEMIKTLDDTDHPVALSLMPDKVSLENKNILLHTKLLSGQYPDILQVVPDETPIRLHLHREELTSLLRQVSLFTSEENCSVRFVFDNGQLTLIGTSSDIGEGTVNMPVDYSGERVTIAFNPFYFLDILRHSKDETVSLALKDRYNPGVITDSSTALFVIMPLRIAETSGQKSVEDVSQNPAFA